MRAFGRTKRTSSGVWSAACGGGASRIRVVQLVWRPNLDESSVALPERREELAAARFARFLSRTWPTCAMDRSDEVFVRKERERTECRVSGWVKLPSPTTTRRRAATVTASDGGEQGYFKA